jgi:hypothetical protein
MVIVTVDVLITQKYQRGCALAAWATKQTKERS